MMNVISFINEYLTSPALTAVMICCGAYFTKKLRLYDPKKLIYAFTALKNDKGVDGISPFSSLTVALAGTLGVGNIAGVAVAVSVGGAGAVFWMIVSSLLGASLKYCEAYLTIKTRKKDRSGGAPIYIETLCKRKTGVVYAVLCVCASAVSGSFIQTNAAASSLYLTLGVPKIVCGAVFAVLCAVIVLGGCERVSSFTSAAMPLFCAVFFAMSVIAVSMRTAEIPAVVTRIFTEAFGFSAAAGGFSGAVVASAVREGMTKGVFSHEAGCGTSSFSHAASSASSPVAQGAVGIVEVLTDTLVFGGMTALVLLLSGEDGAGYDGMSYTISAYARFFGTAASYMICTLTVFFAFAAVICQSYYGCQAVKYITNKKSAEKAYVLLFSASLTLGAVISPSFLWHLSDVVFAVMLFINCACLICGRKMIKL